MKTHLKIISAIIYMLASFWLISTIMKMVSAKNDIEVLMGIVVLIAYLYVTIMLIVKSIKTPKPIKNEKSNV